MDMSSKSHSKDRPSSPSQREDPAESGIFLISTDIHERYMRMAIREAQLAAEKGEVPAGCIIVDPSSGSGPGFWPVIGRAHNQVELLEDPTAHAEMIAITQAATARGDWRLNHTILYVTKEPCSMCAGAIVLARVSMVVFGVADPQRGGAVSVFNILNHPNLNHRCEVVSGILEDECRALLQDFFRAKRPAANQKNE
jgi:tRNA(adenine34) deaminase